MNKGIYSIIKFILFCIIIALSMPIIFTVCSLEGDINKLRKITEENQEENPEENPDENPVPDIIAPNAPIVTASDSMLTVRWTAVEGAESYEIFLGTTQNPPAKPERTVTVTTVLFDGLVNKTVYYIWIKAVNENGSSNFSPYTRGIPWPANEAPAVPGRPVIIPGINQLTVTWEESGGATSYEVFINTTSSIPSTPSVTTDRTSAVVNNLENDVIYYIWVRAVNSVGKSSNSPVEVGTPHIPTMAPATPAKPVLVAGNREISVSWEAVELTESYEVWIGTLENSALAQQYGSDVTSGVTETTIAGLINETTYYVWIKAKNVIGTSGFSTPSSVKPSAFAVLPQTPNTPTVVSGNGELSISWQVVEGAIFYEVWMGTTNNSTLAAKYGGDVYDMSVTITSLNNGITYYVWIMAKNNVGTSNFSSVANGKPLGIPGVPTITAEDRRLDITWTAVPGADEYDVYYGTTAATTLWTTTAFTTATITQLTDGITYYIRLRARNSTGVSDYGPSAHGTPDKYSPGLYRNGIRIGNQNLNLSLSYISINTVTGDNFDIIIGEDESVSSTSLNFSGKTVGITLYGYGGERTINLNSNGNMFIVNNGVTLTLDENITLIGRSANNTSLVRVDSGGTFIMNGGIISGNTTIGDNIISGGGVYVGSNGIFTMNGGSINGNAVSGNNTYGGGVCVGSNGTFIMNDGSINENTANNGGGGVRTFPSAIFTMNNGSINGNSANSGGGVYVDGTFTMQGGNISRNTASRGGGIFIYGTATMQGGSISGNTASNYGGGVYVSDGIFRIVIGTVYGSSESNTSLRNTATTGAALYCSGETVQRGTFIGETWNSKGTLSTTNNTIRVLNGDLQ